MSQRLAINAVESEMVDFLLTGQTDPTCKHNSVTGSFVLFVANFPSTFSSGL